jgi:cysteine desulfurase/selenocysteine lyase
MPLHKLLGLTATTRASLSIYNTKEDVDKLVAGIKVAQKILG